LASLPPHPRQILYHQSPMLTPWWRTIQDVMKQKILTRRPQLENAPAAANISASMPL
jgi:hypothetical protein